MEYDLLLKMDMCNQNREQQMQIKEVESFRQRSVNNNNEIQY